MVITYISQGGSGEKMNTVGFIRRMRLGSRKWKEGAEVGGSRGDAFQKTKLYGFEFEALPLILKGSCRDQGKVMVVSSFPSLGLLSFCSSSSLYHGLIEQFFKWRRTMKMALKVHISSNRCCIDCFGSQTALKIGCTSCAQLKHHQS